MEKSLLVVLKQLWRAPQYTYKFYIILTFNLFYAWINHIIKSLSIENETFNFIISKQSVKHVFPFQTEFSKKKKKILHRVREKSKSSILKWRKKAQQEEDRARDGFTKLNKKEVRRKIMKWLEKAGLQTRL